MNYLNDQLKSLYNVNENDYRKWCKEKKRPMYKRETISDFFYKLRTGRLVKTEYGHLVVKKPRRK